MLCYASHDDATPTPGSGSATELAPFLHVIWSACAPSGCLKQIPCLTVPVQGSANAVLHVLAALRRPVCMRCAAHVALCPGLPCFLRQKTCGATLRSNSYDDAPSISVLTKARRGAPAHEPILFARNIALLLCSAAL